MNDKSDITELLKRVEKLQEAAEVARGGAQKLVKAAPLEIHFYNIATQLKRDLDGFHAMLADANGTYNVKQKDKQS